jgi:type IV pilus assembly protein PilA
MSSGVRERQESGVQGFTLIELLLVVAVIAILAAIALPAVMRARISANEASAVAAIRTVVAAEHSYASSAGGGYASSLTRLGTACPQAAPFISDDLVTDPSIKGGYRIRVQAASGATASPLDCNGEATVSGFYVTATPLSLGYDGHRGFASNAGGAIFYDSTGAAPVEAQMVPGGAPVVR